MNSTIFSQNGKEPASDPDMDLQMEESFNPRYGSNIYGCFYRFAVKDQLRMVPKISNPNEVV